MRNINNNQQSTQTNLVLGGILIALGIAFLLNQLFGFRLGHYVWPFYIMVPGLLLFILALSTEGEGGGVLASIGSVVTMTGLLLFYQNLTNHFESWAYGWALVSLTSIGLGRMLYGTLKDQAEMVRDGKRLATIGFTIFLVGAVFFELIIGISGFGIGRLGRFALPILLIGAGAFFILRNVLPGSNGEQPRMPDYSDAPTVELNEPATMTKGSDNVESKSEKAKAETLSSI